MSQNQQIINHLQTVGNISFMEAWNLYNVRSLPRRICDIKKMGFNVTSEMKTANNNQRYARYSLVKKAAVVKPEKWVDPLNDMGNQVSNIESILDGKTHLLWSAFTWSDTVFTREFWLSQAGEDGSIEDSKLTTKGKKELKRMLRHLKALAK